jgi:hypothetical protein
MVLDMWNQGNHHAGHGLVRASAMADMTMRQLRWLVVEHRSMTGTTGEDAMLDFLICWHLASGAEGRPHVMAALRRRAASHDHGDGDGSGPRLWWWCTSVWLPGWMRAAGLLEEARALEKSQGAMVPRARRAAREAAMRRTGGAPLVCTVIERARAFAAVDASGSAAVHCCGVEGDLPTLVYVAARDAAYVALRDRVDLDRVVARLRCSALALLDGITMEQVPDAPPDGSLGGDTPSATNGRQGGPACPT